MMNQPFENRYQEKLHLVYGAIRQLHIQGNIDEFYQIGLVALWEASIRYDCGKLQSDMMRKKESLTNMPTLTSLIE